MLARLSGFESSHSAAPEGPNDPEVFLRGLVWEPDAPEGLIAAASSGDLEKFLRRWRQRLPARGAWLERLPLSEGLPHPIGSVLFDPALRQIPGLPFAESNSALVAVITSLLTAPGSRGKNRAKPSANGQSRNGHSGAALDGSDESSLHRVVAKTSPDSLGLFERLLLCDLLYHRGRDLSDDDCWAAWSALHEIAAGSSEFLENSPGCQASPLARVLIGGEFPWKASLLLAGIEGSSRLQISAKTELSEHLRHRADAEGLPQTDLLPTLPSELALHARCSAWGDTFDAAPLDDERSTQFAGCVRAAIACCFPGGPIDPCESADALALLEFAADTARFRRKSRPRLLLGAAAAPRRRGGLQKKDRRRLEEDTATDKRPSFQSDETRLALLRTSWSPTADALSIAFQQRIPQLHLTLAGIPFLAGPWELAVRVDGEPVALADHWNATCWFNDDDADYLEIQQILPGGLHIERQMLLSRRDRFLVLADCVSHTGDAKLEYRSRLPFSPGVNGENDIATRECWLTEGKRVARLFPAALDDDRVRASNGSLIGTTSAVELRQSNVGGLFAPLVIDWNPDRTYEPADWRTLTVTENGRPVGPAVASGHRVRIGSHQLLLYRAVRRGEDLRAVLGYHTKHETVIGLFDSDGDVSPLLLVE